MKPAELLLIEDDPHMRRLLELILSKEGYRIDSAEGGEEGIRKIQTNAYDLILTDLQMEKVDGMMVLASAKKHAPQTPVIIITGYGTVKSAVEAMQKGAINYISKPIDNEELKLIIQRTLEITSLSMENKTLAQDLRKKFSFDSLIGRSPAVRDIKDAAREVAPTDSTVLITGESGTGKELLARAIHYQSNRRRRPLATINCAAIPDGLLESELFGYEKGAFTDAKTAKPGRFLAGNQGTLFLDEISELSPKTQVKLLRVLQEKEIEPLGTTQTVKIDVRVIAATSRNLRDLIREGAFREDLYYRLNVFPIHLPPLRNRREDIPVLAAHFLETYTRDMGKRCKGFSDKALALLEAYAWPGNIRELQNMVERVLITCKKDVIEPEDLPEGLIPGPMDQGEPKNRPSLLSFGLTLEKIEEKIIHEALEKTHGNISSASKLLGMTRGALRYRLQKYKR